MRAPRSHIQRQFNPPMYRVSFTPERVMHDPPAVLRRSWSGVDIVPAVTTATATESNPSASTTTALIPKPEGEVTRLKRGGYSLETTLGWSHERYVEIQVSQFVCLLLLEGLTRAIEKSQNHIHELVNTHLKKSLPITKQNTKQLRLVCKKVG